MVHISVSKSFPTVTQIEKRFSGQYSHLQDSYLYRNTIADLLYKYFSQVGLFIFLTRDLNLLLPYATYTGVSELYLPYA